MIIELTQNKFESNIRTGIMLKKIFKKKKKVIVVTTRDDLKKNGGFDPSNGTYKKYIQYFKPLNDILTVPGYHRIKGPREFIIEKKKQKITKQSAILKG